MTLAELEYTKVCEAVISTWSVPKHAQEQDLNDLTLLATVAMSASEIRPCLF